MKCLFYIITGTVIGAYLSQNYIIPDIKKLLDQGMNIAKTIEQQKNRRAEKQKKQNKKPLEKQPLLRKNKKLNLHSFIS